MVLSVLGVALACNPSAQAESVASNEILQNPAPAFDSNGEWSEIVNPTGSGVDSND